MALPVLAERVKMTVTGTPGSGTFTLGTAVLDPVNGDYRTFAQAGIQDQQIVSYCAVDGHNWEYGRGQYSVAGTKLTRSVIASNNINSPINATSNTVVFITSLTQDSFSPIVFGSGEYTRVCTNELVTVSAGGTIDMLNIAPSTPGYVDFIHFDIECTVQSVAQNCLVKVFIDGETAPSFMTDLVGLCGTAAAANSQWSMKHVHFASTLGVVGTGIYGLTYNWKYPIPFKSSCHITFTCDTGGACNFWSDMGYRYNITHLGYKLWNKIQTFAAAASAGPISIANQGNGTTQFLNLGSTQSGIVIYHSFTGVAASVPSVDTYLENNLVAYIDGQTPLAGGVGPGTNAQIDTNGTEDYFTGGFYWAAINTSPWGSTPWMMLTNKAPGVCTVGIDILEAYGGWSFNNGILIRWETGQRANPGTPTTTVDVAWNIAYYQPYN